MQQAENPYLTPEQRARVAERQAKGANNSRTPAEPVITDADTSGADNQIDFGFINSTQFAAMKFETKWLVDFTLKAGQPCIMAGPSKTLKTSLLVEAGISLATGHDFLGEREVAKCNVAIVSAESGEETLQETANRVCASKEVDFSSLGKSLFWAFRPPQIDEPSHIQSLEAFIRTNSIDVLAIDPAYLSMGIGNDAANQFVVGAVLQNLTELQTSTGVTPILCAHTNKGITSGRELSLPDIAYAGFGQWARQWWLLNRRKEYNAESPGNHELYFTYGGSAGHSGSWAIDIEEGRIQDGRQWDYTVTSAAEAAEAAEIQKDQRKRDAEFRQQESDRAAIQKAMRGRGSMSKSNVEAASGVPQTRFRRTFAQMEMDQTVIPGDYTDSLGRPQTGWKLARD